MDNYTKVHFIGIGGYGMSALALVMLDMKIKVSGSDISSEKENSIIRKLKDRNAIVYNTHSAHNIAGADLVVYSSSISQDNIERIEANRQGLPTIHRSEMLAKLLNSKKGVAVAGAHGKTTTSSMIAQTLEQCKIDPTYIIGGEIVALKNNAKAGNSDYVIAEADESDGSFLAYLPYISVITNIEADHLENYENNFAKLEEAYQQFMKQTRRDGKVILCLDDSYLASMTQSVNLVAPIISYGIKNKNADYTAQNIVEGPFGLSFDVYHHQDYLGEVKLQMPGKHNVLNALAALATVLSMNLDLEFGSIAKALGQFQGAKRRFQTIGEIHDILVVDDYAHHPTEIKATLSASKALNRRIIAVFQPQRYSRTHFLLHEFSEAFTDANLVIINTIYAPPGEEPIPNVSAERLAELIRQNSNPNTLFIDSMQDIVERVLSELQPGDMLLTLGAGNIWQVANWTFQSLQNLSLEEIRSKLRIT